MEKPTERAPGADQDNATIDGSKSAVQAVTALLESTRREFCFYTPLVAAALLNAEFVIETLRRRVTTQPKIRCQFILPPAASWRLAGPHRLHLSAGLPTAGGRRTPPPDEPRDRP
ncbi:MAG: hypothetical protein ACFCBW_03835, partial [Candidatus Competibacterales bacterium]